MPDDPVGEGDLAKLGRIIEWVCREHVAYRQSPAADLKAREAAAGRLLKSIVAAMGTVKRQRDALVNEAGSRMADRMEL